MKTVYCTRDGGVKTIRPPKTMNRQVERMLLTKFKGMKQKAADEFARSYIGDKNWNEGYARGYDVAMNAVIETIKEMRKSD